jgi:exodeoxyribonuclease VII large subunit
MSTRLELHKRALSEMLRSHALGKIRGRIENALQKLDHLVESLERAAIGATAGPRKRLDEAVARLSALDPRAVLARGFALCTDPKSGHVLGSAEDALRAGAMNVTFHDGTIGARVKGESK